MKVRAIVTAAATGLVAAASVVLVTAGSVAAEQTAIPAGNLVTNPGAEANAGALRITDDVKPSGWITEGRGSRGDPDDRGIIVLKYQPPGRGYLHTDDGAAVGGGRNYFAGGSNRTVSTAAQTIDVGGAATEIDAGGVQTCLSAYLGGTRNNPDNAQVDVEFLGEDETRLGQLRIGPVTAAQRKNEDALLRRATSRTVPANTRQMRVTLTARNADTATNFGFADNISVALTKANCEPVLVVKCVKKALVATVTPSAIAKTQRVRFAVKGGKRTKQVVDARAPYTGSFTMDGLTGKLSVTATVTQKDSGPIVLTKKSRRC